VRSLATSTPAPRRSRTRRGGQGGFALVEILVSAMIVVTVSGGALAALQANEHAGSEERHRARAYGVAQEDQARLRSLRISDLSNLAETRTVTADGTAYEVVSAGEFVTDSTGTASCTQGTASADYIRITSSVSWSSRGSRPPALLQSTVAPPNGSISTTHGALAVAVQNGQNQGVAGVGLSGTGAGSFSGTTGSNGCAIFGNLPAGNYTLTPTSSGLVDRDGNAPEPLATSVVALSTNTVVLQYDTPGSVDVTFTTRVGGTLVPSSADSVVAFNTGMTDSKAFGSIGTPAATLTATPLFPFASPDTVYAGNCTDNNPNPDDDPDAPGAAAMANVVVLPGGTVTATVELPALHLTAFSGTGSSSPGSPVNNAHVTVTDRNCTDGGNPVKRTFATNSAGQLADPGLPWGSYDVCVDNGVKRVNANGVELRNFIDLADFVDGTSLDVYLGSGSAGTCP
jgi:Tfp pilus assembly protein PilV